MADTPEVEMSEEERMAAEWAAADAAEEEGGGSTARVLSQNEIDSLLGFGDGGPSAQDNSGIMALINSALVNYERLPMLEVVFDRLVRMMSTSLRNFTSDNVEVSLDQITSVRFGDYLNSIPLPAMLTVFKAEEWDNSGLMTIDSAMIYSIVDVLLGGRRGTAAMRIEGRPYTTIERNLVERLVRVVLADMSGAFDPLSPVTFRFDRLETNPRFATIARPANAAVLAKLRIDMEDRGGRIEILIPYATLEPIRELLLQMFMGEKFGRDTIWETHLGNELLMTDMHMRAVLDEVTLPLHEIMSWKPGSQLMLNVKADDLVALRAGDTTLFRGRMGSINNKIAVKVEEVTLHKEED
ncbi:MAG: flagellar motor switch protein FliM [Alphaproteobacteria bacterium]|nr:flagellar motor switch protein FliM [Alphaproteobacteria bacterium]MBV8548907.1 flagellar motor switch protein FliM [Alphaproteobacteria bacterium]